MISVQDIAEDLLRYEHGKLTDDETVELFQSLIDSGLAWVLEGPYGHIARRLIDLRLCLPKQRNLH